MKNTVLLLCLILTSLCAVQAQSETINPESKDNTGYAIEWEKKRINLGEVSKGDSKSDHFTFKNVGSEDIIIELVTSCECTELDWPIDPVKPGEKGTIDFTFNSAEKDKSEEISIDIILTNTNKETGYQIVEQVFYTYKLLIK